MEESTFTVVFDPDAHYYGKACIRCGSTIRYLKYKSCVKCQRGNWYAAQARDPIGFREKQRQAIQKWNLKNPERKRATDLASEQRRIIKPPARISSLACGAIRRGKESGLICSSRDELVAFLMGGDYEHCACCGKRLDYSRGRGVKDRNDSPSLDRVDPRDGYTLANTRIICWRCNDLKGDILPEEVIPFMDRLVAYMSTKARLTLVVGGEGGTQ